MVNKAGSFWGVCLGGGLGWPAVPVLIRLSASASGTSTSSCTNSHASRCLGKDIWRSIFDESELPKVMIVKGASCLCFTGLNGGLYSYLWDGFFNRGQFLPKTSTKAPRRSKANPSVPKTPPNLANPATPPNPAVPKAAPKRQARGKTSHPPEVKAGSGGIFSIESQVTGIYSPRGFDHFQHGVCFNEFENYPK